RGLACFEELGLPSADRLLGDLLLPSRFSDGDLAGQHAQHDPGLGLRTEHRWSSHGQVLLLSDADHALITGLPESMTRDKIVPITLVTDNGGPFRSFRFEHFITAHPELRHVRTRVRTPGQNGVRERAFQS